MYSLAKLKKTFSIILLACILTGFANIYSMEFNLTSSVSYANGEDFADGNGTAENPYKVSTHAHLNNVRNYRNAHFIQINDIDLTDVTASDGAYYNGGLGWNPIGTNSGASSFSGTYDGGGYTITGLKINSNSTYVGLFGYNTGNIKNLGMIDGSVASSSSYAGGIVGYNYYGGVISNCYNTGSVPSAASLYVGGIAGVNYKATISNCYNTGSVSASSRGGGIVGKNDDGIITNCYNMGSVYSSEAGGIAGESGILGIINNCYNTGNISSSGYTSYAGGIAGSNAGTISNCYNTESVSASASNSSRAGGISGYDYAGLISKCYNKGNISASASTSYAGGIAGEKYTGTISNCYNTGSVYADSTAGGIAGRNYRATISNCYNTGSVSSYSSSAGGIGGNNDDTIITNCYNTGSVSSATSFYVGGIAGYQYPYGKISNCYTIIGASQSSGYGTVVLTVKELQEQNSFTGFDFTEVWGILPYVNNGYPVLLCFGLDFISAEQVTLDKTVLIFSEIGETKELTATVYPEDADNKAVIWESGNEEVATVVDGAVTAHAPGNAVITAKLAVGDKTASCDVIVLQASEILENITQSSSFKNELGKTINKIGTAAFVKSEFRLSNFNDVPADITLFAAFYTADNKFISMLTKNVRINEQSMATDYIEYNPALYPGLGYIKSFVWDSAYGLRPVNAASLVNK